MDNQVKADVTAAVADIVVSEVSGKKWYESKTFWVNVVAALAVIGQIKFGFVVDSSIQALALTGINLALRKVTKDPIVF